MGRFAPTPSGDLHIGSLVAAVASAADAKHLGGLHKIRIDDIDPPRIVAGSAERIQQAIHDYHIPADGEPLLQSACIDRYHTALHQLSQRDALFACSCSRKALKDGNVCVSSCQTHRIDVSRASIVDHLRQLRGVAAIRLDTSVAAMPDSIHVEDVVQAPLVIEDVTLLGHPVLWRKDGYVSYLTATAVNDSEGITDVIRGADLWPETPTQQLVMQLLQRAVPRWGHVPCAVDEHNHKLGKQTRAASIHQADQWAEQLALLHKVWIFLGQSPHRCGSLEEFWSYAAVSWNPERIPALQSQPIE